MHARILESIEGVPSARWNELRLAGNPFVRHEFLAALENTGCVGGASGWNPQHIALEDEDGLCGAIPLYEKDHSWGEFVFDWSWARAYSQSGLPYYPKLVCMAPFSPVPSPKLLVHPDRNPALVRAALITALMQRAKTHRYSSAHVLFTTPEDTELLQDQGFLRRHDCQFHWHNRGYQTFDEFLATFRAEKRKKALRERRRVKEDGVVFRTLHGDEMDANLWRIVFAFSENTFQTRGHEHYLSTEFFIRLAASMPAAVMVKLAIYREQPIAAAIFVRGEDALYGRYWGAAAEFHSLHFETCYYQGIEYCIEHGLQRFEPGTQGEHKIARGFEPAYTYSAHWIADPRFRRAIGEYLAQERAAIDQYMESVREHTPFRRDIDAQVTQP
jgi:predicted N-acyltransferase